MAEMNLIQAADEVRKILRGFKAVELVSDTLEQAGSLQNAIKESEKNLETLRKKVAEEIAAVESAKAEVSAAKAEAKKIKENAIATANDRISKAEGEVIEKMSACQSAIYAANCEFNEAKNELENTIIAKAEAVKELEFIEKKILAARKQVASILG